MGGPSDSTQQSQRQVAQAQTNLANQQAAQGKQLNDLVFPGLQTAENWYQSLAKGNPQDLQKLLGPANNQIASAATSAKQNIQQSMPRGGSKDLAKQMVDINAAGQVGQNATKAYTGAFPALAQMGNQGIGLSINEIANAISGNSSAGTQFSNIGQEQAAGKASTLGFLGSLAGAGGAMAAGA